MSDNQKSTDTENRIKLILPLSPVHTLMLHNHDNAVYLAKFFAEKLEFPFDEELPEKQPAEIDGLKDLFRLLNTEFPGKRLLHAYYNAIIEGYQLAHASSVKGIHEIVFTKPA